MIVTENTQATLDRLILVLAEAVNSLADAVENGALEDKHNAAKWVEEVAHRIVLATKSGYKEAIPGTTKCCEGQLWQLLSLSSVLPTLVMNAPKWL